MSNIDFSWCNENGYTTVINSCNGGTNPRQTHPLKNEKKYNLRGSTYTDLKKCLTVTKTLGNKQSSFQTSVVNSTTTGGPTNIGGPGDFTLSIQKCCKASGKKARLRKYAVGVDKKHGSFERYLARKKGWVYRCQNDNGTASNCITDDSSNLN